MQSPHLHYAMYGLARQPRTNSATSASWAGNGMEAPTFRTKVVLVQLEVGEAVGGALEFRSSAAMAACGAWATGSEKEGRGGGKKLWGAAGLADEPVASR